MFKCIRFVKLAIFTVLLAQLVSCGTLMYPERRGQRSGRIDAGVAILDGVGLLLFVIPGIIAFVIDFHNGTIYLPGTSRTSLDLQKMKAVKFDAKHYTDKSLEKILKQETGFDVKLNASNIIVTRLGSRDEVRFELAKIYGMQN